MSIPSNVPGTRGVAVGPVWHPVNRVLFRFGLIYFVLWAPNYFVGFVDQRVSGLLKDATSAHDSACRVIVGWVRAIFFGLEEPLGNLACWSVDAEFTFILVAALGATIWSVIDRRRKAYPVLSRLLIGACRYDLAAVLYSYGIMKLIPHQFAPPGPDRLLTAFGEHGRVDLLWGLIGSSPAYTMFTGGVETTAALLLFFRRTRTLGALLAAAAMLNVTVLNFTYSIGVKLLSCQLLALALILVLVDWRRIANVLVLMRPAPAPDLSPSLPRGKLRVPSLVLKLVLLGTWAIYLTSLTWRQYWLRQREPEAPLYGLYDVKSFVIDGEEVPPLITDGTRWQNVILGTPRSSAIRMMNDDLVDYVITVDTLARTLTMAPPVVLDSQSVTNASPPASVALLAYEERQDGELLLRGTLSGHEATVALREHGDENFPLLHDAGGSDDRTETDIRLFLVLLVPTGGIIWTLIDRRRRPASLLRELLTTAGRFCVGIALCAYGFAKVIPTQFSLPTIQTLMTEFGRQSPTEALRNVMGASPAYTMFTGWTEVIAGTLLFFSRTRMMGALAAIAVVGHSVILNHAYDLPLKLFSSHLLLMAILLAAPDGKRLFDALVRSRAVRGVEARSLLAERFGDRRVLLATLVITAVVWSLQIGASGSAYQQHVKSRRNTLLYGLYDVQSFALGGSQLPPLATDTVRWQNMIIEAPGEAVVRMMNDDFVRFAFASDAGDSTITIAPPGHRAASVFAYERPADDILVLRGTWNSQQVEIRLRQRNLDDFFLVRQRFAWIEGNYSIFWQPRPRR